MSTMTKTISPIKLPTYNDQYSATFDTFKSMDDFLFDLENILTDRKNVAIDTLCFVPITDKDNERYRLASFISNEAYEDACNNTGLGVVINGNLYPVGESAYKSVFDRAKIGGYSLKRLTPEKLSEVLNICNKLYKKQHALVYIANEKVRAILSGGSEKADGTITGGYTVMPVSDLLDCIMEKLTTEFPDYNFLEGFYDNYLVSATFDLNSEEIVCSYETLISSIPSFKGKKIKPVIRFSTSEIGLSCAQLTAYLAVDNYRIPIGSAVKCTHKGENTMTDFQSAISALYAKYKGFKENLDKLEEIIIEYPENCMEHICKKKLFPRAASYEAIAKFSACIKAGEKISALDVFFALQEIPFFLSVSEEHYSGIQKMQLDEKLIELIHDRRIWKNCDVAKGVEI